MGLEAQDDVREFSITSRKPRGAAKQDRDSSIPNARKRRGTQALQRYQ